MRNIHIQVAIFLASGAGFALPAVAQVLPGWTLVWADEFTQPNGSVPDPAKWGYDIGGTGWGNNELEYYTSRTNNARIENGQLVIEARQESYLGKNYTSARLLTKGKWAWTRGRIEGRIQVPRGQGIWPAFWMLGANIDSVGWPTCGEIDIMENIGSEPATVHGTIHGPGYSGGSGIGGPYVVPGGGAVADAFHVFAIEWETNRIRWYVDNNLYFNATPANLPAGKQWVFNAPQFLIMNLAVGGNWPGNPNGSTTFPQRMTVDYVRIYAPTNAAGCGANLLPNPSFELGGLDNWSIYGAGFNTLLENASHVPVRSGSNVLKLFGQFSGSENYSGALRDTATTPGTSYIASGWALTPTGDPIAGGNTAWIEVSFRDASAAVLSLYRSALITSNTPAGVWLNLAVTNQINPATFVVIGSVTNLVAPAGATSVRYQLVFRQPASAAGSVVFDDLNLSRASVGETPVTATATTSGGHLSIVFPTFDGLTYLVRYKNDLSDSMWQLLATVSGDGGLHVVADALNAGRRFYHVVGVCN